MALGIGVGYPFASAGPSGIRFDTPGLVTLPSWATMICASTRTVDTAVDTVLRGVGINQAVAGRYGLLMEVASSNQTNNSEFVGGSTFGHSPPNAGTRTLGQADPAGGTSAAAYVGSANNYLETLSNVAGVAAPYSLSIWAKCPGHGNTQDNITPYANGVIDVAGPADYWRRYGISRATGAANSALVIEARSGINGAGNTTAPNFTRAFIQIEPLPIITQYIPTITTGVAATRAAAMLTLATKATTGNNYRFKFWANKTPVQAVDAGLYDMVVGDTTALTGLAIRRSDQKPVVLSAGSVTSAGVHVFSEIVKGAVVEFAITQLAGSTAYTAYVNGTQVATETLATGFTLATNAANILSDYNGTNHTSPLGIAAFRRPW